MSANSIYEKYQHNSNLRSYRTAKAAEVFCFTSTATRQTILQHEGVSSVLQLLFVAVIGQQQLLTPRQM